MPNGVIQPENKVESYRNFQEYLVVVSAVENVVSVDSAGTSSCWK